MSETTIGVPRSKILYVGLEPFKLLIAELTQAAGLKVKDVDQCNEMDTVLIETEPARALASTLLNTVRGKAFRHR